MSPHNSTSPTGALAGARVSAASGILAACTTALTLIALLVSAPTSATPSTPLVPARFTINGAGFGHGIGMSQYGARGMAKDGFTADQIIAHYYPGTTIDKVTTPQDFKVGLVQDATNIYLRGNSLGDTGGKINVKIGTAATTTVDANTVIAIKSQTSAAKVSVGDTVLGTGTSILITWNGLKANKGSQTLVKVAQKPIGTDCTGSCAPSYAYGKLLITFDAIGDSKKDLNVVNVLRLSDEYMYGIGEMPSSWEPAALQTQVIAARAYAMAKYNNGLRGFCACHVTATIADQNFVGYKKEAEKTYGVRWKAAVNATIDSTTKDLAPASQKWKVVTYNDRPIMAFFSSSTGGHTQPSAEVWGSALPWAISVDDHWSVDGSSENPNASWSKTISQVDLVALLAKANIDIPDVMSLQVAARYASGAVKTLAVSDSGGNVSRISVGPQTTGGQQTGFTPDGLRLAFGIKASFINSIVASEETTEGSSNSVVRPLTANTVTGWPGSRVYFSSKTTFSGTVEPAQFGVKVSVQTLEGTKWVTQKSATSTLTGKWKLDWQPGTAAVRTMRIVAKNRANYVVSDTHTSTYVGRITLVAPTSAKTKSSVAVTGRVTPATNSASVVIEKLSPDGSWVKVGSAKTNAKGAFSAKYTAGGTKQLEVIRARTNNVNVGRVTSKIASIQITKK